MVKEAASATVFLALVYKLLSRPSRDFEAGRAVGRIEGMSEALRWRLKVDPPKRGS